MTERFRRQFPGRPCGAGSGSFAGVQGGARSEPGLQPAGFDHCGPVSAGGRGDIEPGDRKLDAKRPVRSHGHADEMFWLRGQPNQPHRRRPRTFRSDPQSRSSSAVGGPGSQRAWLFERNGYLGAGENFRGSELVKRHVLNCRVILLVSELSYPASSSTRCPWLGSRRHGAPRCDRLALCLTWHISLAKFRKVFCFGYCPELEVCTMKYRALVLQALIFQPFAIACCSPLCGACTSDFSDICLRRGRIALSGSGSVRRLRDHAANCGTGARRSAAVSERSSRTSSRSCFDRRAEVEDI